MKRSLLTKTMLLLCALITGSSSAWADTGTLVSALNGISSGDTYYIAALNSSKYYTVPNTTISGQTFTCSEGTLSGSTLTPASGAGEFVFTAVDGVDNAFYIYNTNLSKYLVATGSKTFGYVDLSSDDYGYWTFSTVSSGGFSGAFSVTHSSKTHYMRAYNNSVRCYDGASNNGVYLFKKDPSDKVSIPSISGDTPFITSTEVSITCATPSAAIQYSLDNGSSWNDYSDPFTLTATTTVKAKATKSGLTDSDEASATFTKITPLTVAQARAAIDAGTGTTGVYVRGIVYEGGSSLSNGQMNYWISDDGTETDKFEIYKGKSFGGASFTATTDVQVGDIVVVYGNIKKYNSTYEFDSNSQLFNQIKKVAAPTFSPAAGAVAANTNVTISTTTEGATIYYTTDGTNPTTGSNVYSAPITIDAAKTIKAFAVKDGHPDSDVATAAYTIAVPCATPTFSPAAGEVEKGAEVTISTTTDGATIYYTTDGSTPTTSSSAYSTAITINSATTLKAIAVKDGMANSEMATAAYTVRDYATLPFVYDGGKSNLPSGLTESGLGSDYNNSPKLKFDGTGDNLVLKFNGVPGILTFDIKGNSFSGGTFKVQTSADGSVYSDLATYTTLGDTQSEKFTLASTVRYIKWVYTNKLNGNVALGNIKLAIPEPAEPTTSGDEVYLTTTDNMEGWRTFFDASQAYTVDANTTVYAAQADGGKIKLVAFDDGIPANTPVILHTTSSADSHKMTLTKVGSVTASVPTNILKATTAVSTDLSAGTYRLGYKSTNGVGFYNYASATAPAGIVYIWKTDVNGPAPGFVDFEIGDDNTEGETTGIDEVRGQKEEVRGEFYNLNGQRVAQPTKGLYIVNGKKVIIK